MNKLNYNKLKALNPTVYKVLTNSLGQVMHLVEHPTQGDMYPVIIMHHDKEIAVCSEFYDTNDMYLGSDYEPVYKDGEILCAFETRA